MNQALNIVLSITLGLFHLIVAAIALIEGAIDQGLSRIGVHGQLQELVLLIVGVLLVIAALQLFGRAFAVLIAVFLILLLIHMAAAPGNAGDLRL